jgi:oligopeptide transport system substrate-binding protein
MPAGKMLRLCKLSGAQVFCALRFVWLGCLSFALLLTACGAPAPVPSVPPAPLRVFPTPIPTPAARVLRIGLTRYPDVLDPQRAPLGSEAHVLRLLYEGLTTLDARGNVLGGAAERWVLSADGLQMTFYLRADLQRSDGTPVTAREIVSALQRALDPRLEPRTNPVLLYDITGAAYVDRLNPLARPEEVNKALNNLGVRAVDDRTLVVTFQKPIGYWHYVAATMALFPTDSTSIARDPDYWWARPEGHKGTGAFRLHSIVLHQRIVLVPNANYWRGPPKLDRLELVYFPGGAGLLEAYRRGEIDVASGLSANDVHALDASLQDLVRTPMPLVYALVFQRAQKPFDNKNVRLAFAQAFDREGWVREVFQGMGKAYTRWIPPGVPGAQPDVPGVPAFDPHAAVRTLVNSGYAARDSTAENPRVDCAKLGEIKLTYLDAPVPQTQYQFLAANFTRVFGCPITLEPVTQVTTKIRTPLAVHAYRHTYPHPRDWLALWTCTSAFATSFGYCNKEFDALLARADQERDESRALALYQQAETRLLQDVPAVFTHYGEMVSLIKPYVRGVGEHASALDTEWAGEWGAVWLYNVDLTRVPPSYPRQ